MAERKQTIQERPVSGPGARGHWFTLKGMQGGARRERLEMETFRWKSERQRLDRTERMKEG